MVRLLPRFSTTRSDTIFVTSYTDNPAGWVNETTDPRGIVTKDNYDSLGRTTRTIDDYSINPVTLVLGRDNSKGEVIQRGHHSLIG